MAVLAVLVVGSVYFARKNSNYSDFDPSFGIYAFKAGKADAFLIASEEKVVLIDTGDKNFADDILNRLSEEDVDYIDYLIITHFDKDHVGGAAEVLRNVRVGEVLQNNSPKNSKEYESYLAALEEKEISPKTILTDYEFDLDDAHFKVNAPKQATYDEKQSNNSSLIVSIDHGENSFLFMGDACEERVAEFLAENDREYDFVKMPHHGRYFNNIASFLDEVKPSSALITSSEEELEDVHTTAELRNRGINYYLTRNQDWIIYSDGKSIEIE